VPGSGTPTTPPTQVHDFNGGIMASGLFWTVPAEGRDLWVSRSGRRAVLEMHDVPVIDSFQFFGPNQIAASVSFRIEWRASGPFERRGRGDMVAETDPAAFLGDIAPASSAIDSKGKEWASRTARTRAPTPAAGHRSVSPATARSSERRRMRARLMTEGADWLLRRAGFPGALRSDAYEGDST
jgi:hypothetical protein